MREIAGLRAIARAGAMSVPVLAIMVAGSVDRSHAESACCEGSTSCRDVADSVFCDPVLEIPRLGYLCVGRLCVPPPGCLAGKLACVRKSAMCALDEHIAAERTGASVDAARIAACTARIDGGGDPTKGCFAALETRQDPTRPTTLCLTEDDASALAGSVAAFVLAAVSALDPAFPVPVRSACSAAKKACVKRRMSSLLRCHLRAKKKGVPVDPLCLQKADERFTGGDDPRRSCFARAELAGGCLTSDDVAALAGIIDGFVGDALAALEPTPTPTASAASSPSPTPTATPTPAPCALSGFPACGGACSTGASCRAIRDSAFGGDACLCLPDPFGCGGAGQPLCGGECPAGMVCAGDMQLGPCGCVSP